MKDDPRAAVHRALETLLSELVHGHTREQCWILNTNDPGLLRSLDEVSAATASAVPPGGRSSIAAHVDHLRYALSLMNRWRPGDNPFADADWSAAWRRSSVTEEEWARLKARLRAEAESWLETIRTPADLPQAVVTGMISSVAHLAYHMGAIRQMAAAARGPADPGLVRNAEAHRS